MEPEPLVLTPTEETVRSAAVVVLVAGQLGFTALGNITGNWWPGYLFGALMFAFVIALTAYFARTRNRSFRSVFLLGLPKFLRRKPKSTSAPSP